MKINKKPLPSQNELKQILSYDPLTGECEAIEGTIYDYSYKIFYVNRQYYYLHRCIWKMITNEEPTSVDHIDGDTHNLKLENLRAATHQQNMTNRKMHSNNTSGYKGVIRVGKRYRASIMSKSLLQYIGTFDTKEEAFQAYCNKAKELHGEFARFH